MLTTDPADQYLADVFGNRSAWGDMRNGTEDIYVGTFNRTTVADAGPDQSISLLGATVQAIYYCPACAKETERHPTHGCGSPTQPLRGWGWLDNDGVNFAASIVGALFGAGVWLALGAGT